MSLFILYQENIYDTKKWFSVYVVIGPDASDTVDLKLAVSTSDSNANKWEIKVAQIPCNSMYSPPEGCAQWFIGATGQMRSLNFGDTILQGTK